MRYTVSKPKALPPVRAHVRNEMEYLEYYDKLNDDEKAYVKQFYDEYYNRGLESDRYDSSLLQGEKAISKARRINESLYEDALTASLAKNKLRELTPDQVEVLEAASDSLEWRDALTVGGSKLAVHRIYDQTIRDLSNQKVDNVVILSQFFVKMNDLMKALRKERRREKK